MKKIPLFILMFMIIFLLLAWGNAALSFASQMGGGETPCTNGMAGSYPCQDINLVAYMSNAEMGTADTMLAGNLWGWTDPETGKEYVLMGYQDGTAFVDISNPTAPVYLGKLPTHEGVSTLYRDMKVYNNYAFIVGDQPLSPSTQGLQVFDLTTLRGITTPITFTETAYNGDFANGHNIFIHEETGYAYIVRNSECGGAMVFNVQQPLTPTYTGCYEDDGAASDTHCVVYHGPDLDYQGHEICVISSDDRLVVGDMTTKTLTMTTHLSDLNYTDAERAHHAWFTEDHRYIISADMDDEHHHGYNTRTFIWDMSDLDIAERTPTVIHIGPTTGSDHNVWVKGEYAYIGNLRAGLWILHIGDVNQVHEVAYFDTFPNNDNPGHQQGAWTAYVYFESGIVAVNNREGGLFLLRPLLQHTYLPFAVND